MLQQFQDGNMQDGSVADSIPTNRAANFAEISSVVAKEENTPAHDSCFPSNEKDPVVDDRNNVSAHTSKLGHVPSVK
uniref:Uncharacterized protein n=1 Tax=Solanum tuberosum TaxID=4113 RepID=M1DUL2_SOLTU